MLCIMLSTGDTTVSKRHGSCTHGLQSKEGFRILQIRCFSNINKIDVLPAMAEQLGLGSYSFNWVEVPDFYFLEAGVCVHFLRKGDHFLIFYFKVLNDNTIVSL